MGVHPRERYSSSTEGCSNEIKKKSKMSRRHSETKVKREHLSKDDHVPKLAKLDDGCTFDNDPVAKGKRKKRKAEVANEGFEDLCQDKEENSGLEEIVPGRKAKKRKQKAEVEDVSEDAQIKSGKDAAADEKARQKKAEKDRS